MSFAVIVPTLNAGSPWSKWIEALKSQSQIPDNILIVDSGSEDDTVTLSVDAGFNVQVLSPGTFNHGGTRKQAALQNNSHEVIVFLTQDAILASPDAIKNILLPFQDKNISAVCGRQLPKHNAGHIETHSRLYNYPGQSSVKRFEDRKSIGIKSAFLSNSFSAYRVSTLSWVGGFPDDVIFGEDMYVAAKLLMAGHKISYAADACVYHSHSYSFLHEFKRYFDMGVFHAREPWIRRELGSAEGEGMKFVASEFKYLLEHAFWRIPEGLVRTLLRYTGFRLGLIEKWLPLKVKGRLAMNKNYFDSKTSFI